MLFFRLRRLDFPFLRRDFFFLVPPLLLLVSVEATDAVELEVAGALEPEVPLDAVELEVEGAVELEVPEEALGVTGTFSSVFSVDCPDDLVSDVPDEAPGVTEAFSSDVPVALVSELLDDAGF